MGTETKEEKLTIRQRRIMAFFVEATEKILKEDGLSGASIRRIASEAGYNSATLYNYFPDLENLILYGSVGYLCEYNLLLGKSLKPSMNAKERYETVYRCFNHFAFRDPEIFYNMFFGRYSEELPDVIRTYYMELFPDELEGLPEDMKRMVIRGTLSDRDRIVMKSLVEEGFVAGEKAEPTLSIIVALHESYIHKACLTGNQKERDELNRKFMELFEYVMANAK